MAVSDIKERAYSSEAEAELFGYREGTYVELGRYYQESPREKSPVSWLVLKRLPGKALLLSRCVLDCHMVGEGCSYWKGSDIRSWLNSAFSQEMFIEEERKRMCYTALEYNGNPEYENSGGRSCRNRVFLLNYREIMEYLPRPESRKCQPTPYARLKGVQVSADESFGGRGYCWWWLRNIGADYYHAMFVHAYGFPDAAGSRGDTRYLGVRPALWLKTRD